jgi:hypothetical protein
MRIRPTNDHGERVPPSDLRLHRLSHEVLGPCCLCPLDRNKEEFVESAISMVARGRYAGEYVATCAKDECNYFGEILVNSRGCASLTYRPVCIERIYARRGVPIRHYPLRGQYPFA